MKLHSPLIPASISLFLLLFSASTVRAHDLVINEIMASNRNTIQDEDGDAPDWIELYNPGTQAADLSGWSLSDDTLNVRKWTVNTGSIPAGGYR
ncbi:lamin tail domain-containing protein, partial [bacterium]|nr:lamin tail domain-containing protein [bacterium]